MFFFQDSTTVGSDNNSENTRETVERRRTRSTAPRQPSSSSPSIKKRAVMVDTENERSSKSKTELIDNAVIQAASFTTEVRSDLLRYSSYFFFSGELSSDGLPNKTPKQ